MSAATKKRSARRADPNDVADLRVGLYCRVSKENASSRDRAVREKSVDDQQRVGREWVERNGATLIDTYRDSDRSASRFATKERAEFQRLRADIADGKLDLLWFWEQSRSSRRLEVFAELRNLCRDLGVRWVNRDKVVDPADSRDMILSGMMAVINEHESEQTSERVKRGRESAALAGRPASVSFGYRRVFDPNTGRSMKDEPDTWDGDGRPIEDSPAFVVAEVFDRVVAGDSLHAIVRDLDERGIRSRIGNPISRPALHKILHNVTYIGKRVHRGEVLEGIDYTFTPPLVDEETFWKVQRILADASRLTWRPARDRGQLLSTAMLCAKCGSKMRGRWDRRRRGGQTADVPYYICERGCASIYADRIDPLVEDAIVTWLADPIVVECLTSGDDSAKSKAARADADHARVRLQEWQQAAERGEVDVVGYKAATRGLLARIEEAERLMSATTLSPVLVGKLGDHAADTWISLPVDVKRQLVRTVADIRIKPVPPGVYRKAVPVASRIVWTWLIGPEQGEPIEFPQLELERVNVPPIRPSHCVHGHEFDEQNTHYTKDGYRHCRRCARDREAARRARERAASGSNLSGAATHSGASQRRA